MDNDQVKQIFWKCYNNFWNKWKDEKLPKDSEKWDVVVGEVQDILKKHNCSLCRKVILGLLAELEERNLKDIFDHDGSIRVLTKESETSLDKQMKLVQGYKLVELIAVMQEYEKDPRRFDPEVIKCVAHRLVDMEIMLKY